MSSGRTLKLRSQMRTLWSARLALVLMLGGFGASEASFARSAARLGDPAAGKKIAAPTVEDYADYFSTSRQGLSPDALRQADALRLKTMTSIRSLLADKRNTKNRFELLLRLGELSVERHDYLRDGELDSYGKAWDKWDAGGRKGKEPKPDYTASRNELEHAANSFRQLVTEFPRHPRTDAALFELAKTLSRLDNENAVLYYKQLINTYPHSTLIPDAYLAMGEFYFDRHDIPQAMGAYKEAVKFKNTKTFPYAVYKLGWAYYDAPARNDDEAKQNLKKTVTAFKLVVKLSDAQQNQVGNLNLRKEAINDLIMVWADAGDVQSAWNYFRTIGENGAFYTMLDRLGGIYTDQGKYAQAISVYTRLLNESPNRPDNPQIYVKLLALHDQAGKPNEVVNDLAQMHKLYLGSTDWSQANAGKPDIVKKAQALVESNTHRYGALFHDRGLKTKHKTFMSSAAAIYNLYLTSFPQNDAAYEIRYYLAEILFDFGKYDAAATHYTIVAKARPKNGKYLKDSATNAVGAMNQLVLTTKYPALPPKGQVPAPITLPKEKQKLIDVIDNYVAFLPKEKDGYPMRFTAAQIYFDYGHYNDALKRFEGIVNDLPETKQANVSAKIVLAYYADRQDWDNVIAWSNKFATSKTLMANNHMDKYVTDMRRQGLFRRALALESQKHYDKAALGFLEFQKAFPADGNADVALFNASVNFYRVGKVDQALTSNKNLLTSYPRSKLRPDAMVNVGQTYEALAQFDQAANYYQQLATSYPADKRAPGALFNAALLNKGLNNYDASVALFTQFARSYPNDKLAAQARFEIAELEERLGKHARAVAAYEDYAHRMRSSDADAALDAQAKAAALTAFDLNAAKGQKDLEHLRKELANNNKIAALEARHTVAEALFKSLESKFAEFGAMDLNNPDKIEAQARAKQARLEQLAAGYEGIIALGNAEYTVASLYRLGQMHENFSAALFHAPSPTGASASDVDKFRTSIEKVAFPLKEEANKYYETAYNRSQEVETFTPWTVKVYSKMAELTPDKHPEVLEQAAEPSYLSYQIANEKPVASLTE